MPKMLPEETGFEFEHGHLGYESPEEVIEDAFALFQAFVDCGYIQTKAQCRNITKSPKTWAMGRFIL
jgi:hypothetical protein